MASRFNGWRYVHVVLFAAAVAGCGDVVSLEQEAPSRVVANDLYVPGNAQLLVTSAVSDYECALAQYIIATGLVGDELIASGPDEGHPHLAELCGWRLVEDDETGEQELRPLTPART